MIPIKLALALIIVFQTKQLRQADDIIGCVALLIAAAMLLMSIVIDDILGWMPW